MPPGSQRPTSRSWGPTEKGRPPGTEEDEGEKGEGGIGSRLGPTQSRGITHSPLCNGLEGLRIDGEPVVAAPQVPTRWPSYLDMCQYLLGVDILNLNIIWEPYVLEDLLNVAAICRESSELWRAHVDVTFCAKELLITNPEASYLDVKKEILKLQEDTFNKLWIKIPKYEQPSIPSGEKYTLGESSGGLNIWAHPWTSEQWPNVYDAQSRGISQMDLQMSQWTQDSGVLDALTPVRVPTPPPHIIEGVHIHDQGTQLTQHMEEEGEEYDETQPLRRMIRDGHGQTDLADLLPGRPARAPPSQGANRPGRTPKNNVCPLIPPPPSQKKPDGD
ncbi:hypothetical protein Taro_045244 [Colocasia esculenta]|uniref:Uncharacterized protein n=1 Tax=Colocasia esculenta TaxID=4460 RepID=A0A843WZU9_COLES|nr:hypothetical protein [Colocasia esculenta]